MPRNTKPYYRGKKPVGDNYTPGLKIWTNGVPIKVDTYKSCSNRCTYCYARTLSAGMTEIQGVKYDPRVLRYAPKNDIIKLFENVNNPDGFMGWALRNRYFIEAGTIAEMFQESDLEVRSTWDFIKLAAAFQIPLMINTKGNLLVQDERYFRLLADHPAPIINNMSLISHDDKLLRSYDLYAPTASERLDLIRRLREVGIPTAIYCGPYLHGVTDVDLEGYIGAVINAGAVALHLRNLYLTGKFLANPKWKRYIDDNKEIMTRKGQVRQFSNAHLKEVYFRMQEIARRIDPRFKVVGLKSDWFELEPYHGRIPLDNLPQRFKDGIIEFTAIPIMRKIRERLNEPQLLDWNKIGYKRGAINTPRTVYISGNLEAKYLSMGCLGCVGTTMASPGIKTIDGYDWIKSAMWSGGRAQSFMSTVKRIYRVVDRIGNPIPDLLAYVPPQYEKDYVIKGKEGRKEIGYVPERNILDLYQPERSGGIEDKFLQVKEDWYEF